ncbi:TetR family transcriptional regulator [Herbiconiux sp. 11R-BC]|uniref:TetR/AcrR family transcriptional regulator n=1 Tax=Herbiconiux sp. 11R-BC TaxID=3111637 RepID=UPI003C0743CB
MTTNPRTTERREGALTRDRIVEAAIGLLDTEGEAGLTFRALASRLGTGHGAIQWHVANKGELLRVATATLVERAVGDADPDSEAAADTIHSIALGLFDAIDDHPWIGAQLARPPWQSTMLEIFERIGRQVRLLGVDEPAQFTTTSTLLMYIIGAAGQNATNSRLPGGVVDRQNVLDELADDWAGLDASAYDFTRTMAEPLRTHDDRAEFLAGIDIILAGAATR